LFDDVIIIERRFSRDGGSGYKIKSKSGHIVSTKREELQEILDHIQIQVDNPLTVLTQDTARSFLGNSSVGEKYKLFMRGVQLSQLDTDYTMVEGQISTLNGTLEAKREALRELELNKEKWTNQVQVFERSAEIEEKVRSLRNKFAWTQVKDQEKVDSIILFTDELRLSNVTRNKWRIFRIAWTKRGNVNQMNKRN
jgi:structural maintenance of chromosomes protein 6